MRDGTRRPPTSEVSSSKKGIALAITKLSTTTDVVHPNHSSLPLHPRSLTYRGETHTWIILEKKKKKRCRQRVTEGEGEGKGGVAHLERTLPRIRKATIM